MGIQRKIRILSLFANIGVAEARLNEIDRVEVVVANELVKYKKGGLLWTYDTPPFYIAVILSINKIDLCYLLSHSSIALAITSKLVVGSKRATT